MWPGLRALAAAVGLCSAAWQPVIAGVADAGADSWSYANTAQFRTTHIELSLEVDFAARQLHGGAALELERLDPHATQLVLDTKDLDILGVTELTSDIIGATEKPAPIWISRPFHLGKADPILGSPLVIDLPMSGQQKRVIRIDYVTSPRARGLRWRVPTDGRRRQAPFLYTLSAPINARSWIPLQDTPRVRASYHAHIQAPPELVALMAASAAPPARRRGDSWFVMSRPVPAAALALVVADLRFKATGPRTGVYAEGPASAAAAKGCADAEALLQATEKLLGPYRGERLDLVVMPAGFPVADVDYPQLAMVSPTLLAGEGGLLDSLARAVAHEWTAGLAGPEWRDRWLDEATAAYVADRAIAAVHGDRHAEPPAGQAIDGVLAADLQGLGYDDIFSAVPRTKGRLMFSWLEARAGRSRLDPWLRELAGRYGGEGMTTAQFLASLQDGLLSRDPGLPTPGDVTAWLSDVNVPGYAAVAPAPVAADVTAVSSGDPRAPYLQARLWSPAHWVRVLDAVPDNVDGAHLAALDRDFALSASASADVAAAWYSLALRAGYKPALGPLENYLLTTGRLALLEPLYEQLVQSDDGAAIAKRVFALARTHYDPFVARRLAEIVKP